MSGLIVSEAEFSKVYLIFHANLATIFQNSLKTNGRIRLSLLLASLQKHQNGPSLGIWSLYQCKLQFSLICLAPSTSPTYETEKFGMRIPLLGN